MTPPNTIAGWAIWIVITLAIVALVYVAATVMGIGIPSWVITVFWILVVAVGIVAAIKFLASMGGQQQP